MRRAPLVPFMRDRPWDGAWSAAIADNEFWRKAFEEPACRRRGRWGICSTATSLSRASLAARAGAPTRLRHIVARCRALQDRRGPHLRAARLRRPRGPVRAPSAKQGRLRSIEGSGICGVKKLRASDKERVRVGMPLALRCAAIAQEFRSASGPRVLCRGGHVGRACDVPYVATAAEGGKACFLYITETHGGDEAMLRASFWGSPFHPAQCGPGAPPSGTARRRSFDAAAPPVNGRSPAAQADGLARPFFHSLMLSRTRCAGDPRGCGCGVARGALELV